MLNSTIQNNETHSILFNNVERRQGNKSKDNMWDMLNLSQQYAVCSLGQFGYLLTYVRSFAGSTLAILKQNDKVATVNAAGIINVNPAIKFREMLLESYITTSPTDDR